MVKDAPYHAVFNLNLLSAAGTAILFSGLLSVFIIPNYGFGKAFSCLFRTTYQLRYPILTIAMLFAKGQEFRALPAIAETPFRDRFASIKPKVANPKLRVALFSGCVQDFVYPEQAEAAVKLLGRHVFRPALSF